jgi:hypothetical protein
MTEDKIKEAFEAWWADSGRLMIPDEMEYGLAAIVKEACFVANQAGYMACLNGLEPVGFIAHGSTMPKNERVFEHCSIMTKQDADEYMPECVTALFVLPEGVTKQ